MYDRTLREGSCEPISFLLKRDGNPYNLGTMPVRMLRRNCNKIDDEFATTDAESLLVTTNAVGGIVTFSPRVEIWKWESGKDNIYLVYFEVEVSPEIWYAFSEETNLQIKVIPAFHED